VGDASGGPPDWRLFEEAIRDLVQAFGYAAEATQPSGDGGVDVIGSGKNRRVVIQCKLYAKAAVGADIVRQLAGSRQLHGATDALLIATTRFTAQARKQAKTLDVHLVDGQMLEALCRRKSATIPFLTVLERTPRSSYALGPACVALGRGPKCDIRINSPGVSGQHAFLKRQGLWLYVHDQSLNGTFVNGMRVTHPVVLSYGDELRLADVRLFVRLATGRGKAGPSMREE
jgi:hypothetical protein